MEKQTKRFDGWEDCSEVDCNNCECYWLNQCDAVPEGKKRTCTAFKASRGVVIPQEIQWLKNRLKSLERRLLWVNLAVLFGAAAMLLHSFGL